MHRGGGVPRPLSVDGGAFGPLNADLTGLSIDARLGFGGIGLLVRGRCVPDGGAALQH